MRKDGVLSYSGLDGDATVLITDIVEFTKFCAKHTAIEVVGVLDEIFAIFDQLCNKYHVTKVKTIGDAMIIVG